jgi:hypothetical protein
VELPGMDAPRSQAVDVITKDVGTVLFAPMR